MDLQERVARLERGRRRERLALGILAAIFGLTAARQSLPSTKTYEFEEVRTQRLVVEDIIGRRRIELGSELGGPARIALFSQGGSALAVLEAGPVDASLALGGNVTPKAQMATSLREASVRVQAGPSGYKAFRAGANGRSMPVANEARLVATEDGATVHPIPQADSE